jgi:hypothetical protein
MLESYYKIDLQNQPRNKMRSLIHIPGPSAEIACCPLATFFGLYETNYNLIPKNDSRIVPVAMKFAAGATVYTASITGNRVFSSFTKDFPQTEGTV